jgi:hypothetical protein
VTCEGIQERLDELALAQALDDATPAARELAAHARDCEACGAHRRFLVALDAVLAEPVPAASEAVVATARARAARVLRARETPPRVGRELAAALGAALLALPLVVGHAWLVLSGGAWLLSGWLPAPVLAWLGGVYVVSLALGVGALYGLIPLAVAFRQRALGEST